MMLRTKAKSHHPPSAAKWLAIDRIRRRADDNRGRLSRVGRRISTLWFAVAASLAAHLIAMWLGKQISTTRPHQAQAPIEIDIELPPPAPLADDLSAQSPDNEQIVVPEPVAEAPEPVVAEPPPETTDESVAMIWDAGVPEYDAQAAIATGDDSDDGGALAQASDDGGVNDGGGAIATNDADGGGQGIAAVPEEAPLDDAGAVAMGTSDGGAAATSGASGTTTGTTTGTVAANGATAGGSGTSDAAGNDAVGAGLGDKPPAPGSEADLLSRVPSGEVLAVLVRFDRLRGTEWAPRAAALLAPLPDYRSLVGTRPGNLADWFESLAITSADPRDVSRTTLIARSVTTLGDVRTFVDGAGTRIRWFAAKGGIVGERLPGPLVYPGDQRVFFVPRPQWILLTHKAWLGDAATPTAGELGSALDKAAPPAAWIAQLDQLEAEAGTTDGPALLVTAAGLPDQIRIPGIVEVPGPQQLTLALEVHEKGFVVRGNFVFSDEKRAEMFRVGMLEVRDKYTSTALGKLMLNRAKAYNAVAGLSLRRTAHRVAYATSISIADARLMMDALAIRVGEYFTARSTKP